MWYDTPAQIVQAPYRQREMALEWGSGVTGGLGQIYKLKLSGGKRETNYQRLQKTGDFHDSLNHIPYSAQLNVMCTMVVQ